MIVKSYAIWLHPFHILTTIDGKRCPFITGERNKFTIAKQRMLMVKNAAHIATEMNVTDANFEDAWGE